MGTLRPWIDGRIPQSQDPARLLQVGRSDVEVSFLERVGDGSARVEYPVGSGNEVVAKLAEGVYRLGAVCPATLGSDGRVDLVLPPLDLQFGDEGLDTDELVPVGDWAENLIVQSDLVANHEGRLEATEQMVSDTKDALDATDNIVDGLLVDVGRHEVDIQGAVLDASSAKVAADAAVTGTITEYALSGSRVVAPVSGWSEVSPTPTGVEPFVWLRSVVTYGSGDSVTTDAVPVTGPEGEPGADGLPGTPGEKGDKGDTGAQGVSITGVVRYYALVNTGAAGPATPAANSTPASATWKTAEPAFTPGKDLWVTDQVTYSNGNRTYTTAAKSSAYVAASEAINIANATAEQLAHSFDEEPPSDPVLGAIWFARDEQGRVTGMWQWDGDAWGTHATLTGLLVVPTEDGGQTIIDQNGVEATSIVADILRTDVLYADVAGVKTLVITDIPRQNLADDVGDALATAESLGSRILIDGSAGTLTIARNRPQPSDPLTAMVLGATSLDMIVADKSVAYIDSELEQLAVPNVLVSDSLQVGAHLVRTIPGSGITTFQRVAAV